MSAELLRRAAALMRERAEAVPPEGLQDAWFDADASDLMHLKQYDREHIASWPPEVALAVADWMDADAGVMERHDLDATVSRAYAVARAYLGGDA